MINYSFSMAELEYFLAIVVRITSFIFAAPFFGTPNVPRRVKVAIGVMMSVVIYNSLTPVELQYNTVLGYSVIIIKEAFTGVLLGFSAAICMSIVNFAGHLVDMETGLSMVTIFDPVSRDQVTITGVYYQYTILLILMLSGMHQYVIAAICNSFSLIPVNGAVFASDKLLVSMIKFLVDYLSIGFRLCLPVFAGILLLNAILGILAKVSPQLNMFAVGMQLKILAGLGILFITVGLLPAASTMILSEMKSMVNLFVEALQ